ncbi:hypothetical protein KO465_04100 [Candidatus Micrarchaeota archaeon]|jgi:hypothetical protein|nr:hypothetical protein [Candidatus Micrarchaeota archaeon]
MGLSKKDLGRKLHNIQNKIKELEIKAKADPLHNNLKLHAELAELKKSLAKK